MRMKVLDKELDTKPTKEHVLEMTRTSIRNLQAHRELSEYNSKGKFLNKHPLLNTYSLRNELKELWAKNRPEFLEQYANTRENVKRYRSRLNNPKRNDKHDSDEILLKKHVEKEKLMKEICDS